MPQFLLIYSKFTLSRERKDKVIPKDFLYQSRLQTMQLTIIKHFNRQLQEAGFFSLQI